MKNTRPSFLFLIFICCAVISYSQDMHEAKRSLNATRVATAPKVDGILDDEQWKNVDIATDFIQQSPTPGIPSFQNTEVKIIYDNSALYVGAMLYEESRDSISKALAQRDGIGAADYFGVIIDAYQDGINGLEFLITAAGVQFDAKVSTEGEDSNWDAVWDSEVAIHDNGWSVEYKIPYSALRFPDKEVQKWGFNLMRSTYRNGERVWWSELKPEVSGFLNQAGELHGISNIKPPVRLSFTPFVSYNVNHYPLHDPNLKNTSTSFNAGMDIKYGINEAFTLDMTLVPDFGQVQSDAQILNLSPFETFFNENRQFFTEGTELFSKADVFYSRRIGGTPQGFYDVEDQLLEGEVIVDNPSDIQLINSTKISGRNTKGLGIGVLNSITAKMNAKVESVEGSVRKIETEPFTNYNVLVFDQNLKNNSYVSLINTNVWRAGDAYEANVTGTEFRIRNKKNTYAWYGKGAVSQKYFSGEQDNEFGYKAKFGFSKTSGNFNFSVEHEAVNANYDPNDLGFQRRNNFHESEIELEYNRYKPFGKKFLSQHNGIDFEYTRLYSPSKFQDFGIVMYTWNQFRNFWSGEIWTYFEPLKTYDFYEPRVDGRFYEDPENFNFGTNFSTDRRKRIQTWVNANFRFWPSNDHRRINLNIGPRLQVSDKFNVSLSIGSYNWLNDIGYATVLENDDIIFGKRDRTTVETGLYGTYIFNNKMWLNLRVRHYWSQAKYKEYFLLDDNGQLQPTDYVNTNPNGLDDNDANFKSFNIDFNYIWRFAPGSELSFVWKNSILDFYNDSSKGYFPNFGETFESDQNNLFSIKILYYLDYLYFKNIKRKKYSWQQR